MNRKITLLCAAAFAVFTINAQVAINESFTSPFTPATAGWIVQNNSVPLGTVSWFQGNGANFGANSGNPNDYYAVNYQSQGSTAGGISNFLITPTVTLMNGAIIQFATRTGTTGPGTYPDRLQLLMSQGTGTGAIATGTAAVGTFTTLLADINPSLTTTGYPAVWTVYTSTITGITGTVSGRFAFRYFVNDGGLNGSNSDYIGIDDVKYTLPCGAVVSSYTTCPSAPTVINANGGLSTTTYTWSTGANTTSISVNPATTTVYTLTSGYPGGTCPTIQTSTVTIGSNLSVNIIASSNTICAGTPATLTANSSATSYSWSTSATTASIVVSPTTTSTYSVGALAGTCFGGNTISIVVNPSPAVTITSSATNSVACVNQTITMTGAGATSYAWNTSIGSSTANPIAFSSSVATVVTLTLTGTGANGCTAVSVFNQTVSTCTGIENNTISNNASAVFPNPFTNELTISGVNGSAEIINTLGQVVLTTIVSDSETINTSGLAKGIYYIKVKNTDSKNEKTIKVIKN